MTELEMAYKAIEINPWAMQESKLKQIRQILRSGMMENISHPSSVWLSRAIKMQTNKYNFSDSPFVETYIELV